MGEASNNVRIDRQSLLIARRPIIARRFANPALCELRPPLPDLPCFRCEAALPRARDRRTVPKQICRRRVSMTKKPIRIGLSRPWRILIATFPVLLVSGSQMGVTIATVLAFTGLGIPISLAILAFPTVWTASAIAIIGATLIGGAFASKALKAATGLGAVAGFFGFVPPVLDEMDRKAAADLIQSDITIPAQPIDPRKVALWGESVYGADCRESCETTLAFGLVAAVYLAEFGRDPRTGQVLEWQRSASSCGRRLCASAQAFAALPSDVTTLIHKFSERVGQIYLVRTEVWILDDGKWDLALRFSVAKGPRRGKFAFLRGAGEEGGLFGLPRFKAEFVTLTTGRSQDLFDTRVLLAEEVATALQTVEASPDP